MSKPTCFDNELDRKLGTHSWSSPNGHVKHGTPCDCGKTTWVRADDGLRAETVADWLRAHGWPQFAEAVERKKARMR